MLTGVIEIASVILFVGCVVHAVSSQGRSFAEQFFISAYLFAVVREDIMQVVFANSFYAPSVLRLGAAPALISLLYGSLSYLAFVFACRLAPPKELVPFTTLVYIAAASFSLPIEATAAQARWWLYETPGVVLFGEMPIVAPLLWAGAAAIFFLMFTRIRMTRLPDRGRLYAMITLSPVIAILHVAYTLILDSVL